MSSGNPFPIMINDCELFEQDLFPNEFEYFCKHTQAFKSMWLEKSIEDKIDFVEEFYNYSENYGYIRDLPLKIASKKKYFYSSKDFLIENFAKAKFSAAKHVIQQITLIASNKEKILSLGSNIKGRDPFYNKETRDTFRTFFGQPADPDTWKKTVTTMPIYTRFSGAVCRVLRRWVEGFIVPPEMARKSSIRRQSFDHEENKQSSKKGASARQRTNSEASMKSDSTAGLESDSMSESGSVDNGKVDKSEKEDEKLKVTVDEIKSSKEEKEEIVKNDKNDAPKKSKNRLHHCSCCRVVEPQVKTYKKCALCKGKGTRFYCSKKCQTEDWLRRHKQYHVNRSAK